MRKKCRVVKKRFQSFESFSSPKNGSNGDSSSTEDEFTHHRKGKQQRRTRCLQSEEDSSQSHDELTDCNESSRRYKDSDNDPEVISDEKGGESQCLGVSSEEGLSESEENNKKMSSSFLLGHLTSPGVPGSSSHNLLNSSSSATLASHKGKYPCGQCGRSLTDLASLQRHL
ncbi:unnamed protein product, partial [Allacma fusca]